jgi:hypothetical protein
MAKQDYNFIVYMLLIYFIYYIIEFYIQIIKLIKEFYIFYNKNIKFYN